ATTLGGGGGGGMQFANGYRVNDVSYNGLGLGAGSASNETDVQYSYSDYAGSPSPQPPVHEYNPAVIAEYKNQLKNLSTQLKEGHEQRKTVVLRGGGGMGAGTEYLMASGEQFLPHALSTQAGFQFSYEFQRGRSSSDTAAGQVLGNLNDEQQNIYAFIGEAYRKASQQAFEECGRDYSNYTCICPKTHAIVICLVSEHVGDPELIPAWLQQRHCADDATSLGQTGNGFSSYQKFLLD